jgi:hypothetical protein
MPPGARITMVLGPGAARVPSEGAGRGAGGGIARGACGAGARAVRASEENPRQDHVRPAVLHRAERGRKIDAYDAARNPELRGARVRNRIAPGDDREMIRARSRPRQHLAGGIEGVDGGFDMPAGVGRKARPTKVSL